MEAGAGCLSFIIGLMIMAGEVLLLSGELFGDLADNGIAWVCALLAIVFDIGVVVFLVKAAVTTSKEKQEQKEREHKKRIQDEISEIVNQYDIQDEAVKSNIPHVEEWNNSYVDFEIIACMKAYIKEAEEQEQRITELRAKIRKILSCDECSFEEQKLEYLKGKRTELQQLKEQFLSAQEIQDGRKIILNETTSAELESIREAIREIGKSQKIQNMGELEWKKMTKAPWLDELKYFKSQTKPVILRMEDYCYCICSETILVFTLEGKFATALDRKSFVFRVERNLEMAYFSKSQDGYPRSVAGKDSKCVEKGPERYTWQYTCRDGSRDRRYSNNYMIEYRYDTMEYGKIWLSVAEKTAEFKFSSEKAVAIAEKAASENEKYVVTRESNNESNVINLLQLLEPSSKSARELEERYTKLDVPQKKYCYIERS